MKKRALIRHYIRRGLARGRASVAPKYYSQGGEDEFCHRILGEKSNGFYVDVGCHHPQTLSNTYFFYQRGWSGLCIDPNPKFADLFRIYRPRDRLLGVAVSDYEGTGEIFLGTYDVHDTLKPNQTSGTSSTTVEIRTLRSILDEHQAPKNFDLISIDTEGTEIDVLKGLDLTHYRPRLIVAEYNTAGNINTKLQGYLIQNGYNIIHVGPWNLIASNDFEKDASRLQP